MLKMMLQLGDFKSKGSWIKFEKYLLNRGKLESSFLSRHPARIGACYINQNFNIHEIYEICDRNRRSVTNSFITTQENTNMVQQAPQRHLTVPAKTSFFSKLRQSFKKK